MTKLDSLVSNTQAFRTHRNELELAARAPSKRESTLMGTYELKHEEAKGIDSTVAECLGMSGAILADVEQLEELSKKQDVAKMTDDDLNKTYSMLMTTLGGMEELTRDLSSEEIDKIPLTTIEESEPSLKTWLQKYPAKIAIAVRSEAFKKPVDDDAGYASLQIIASETPNHDQYLEDPWSNEPNRYHHIKPEIFNLVKGMREKVLNAAFERTVAKLRGMPITDTFLAQAEQIYGDHEATTVGEASLTIYPELKAALQIYKESILLSQAPAIDTSDDSFSKLKPVLLGVDAMRGYSASSYSRTDNVPLGRQWLEVGPDHLKYIDVVKGAAKLYTEKFVDVDHHRRSREISESTTWENSWVSPQTSADIAENGMSAYLEKNLIGFDKLESPYKEAKANIFTAVAAQQAQECIWQWTNTQDENFDYSVLPSVGDCVSLLPNHEDPKQGFKLRVFFHNIQDMYEESFRTVTQPPRINLLHKKSEFDYSGTITKIGAFRLGHTYKTVDELFGRNTTRAMLQQFEHRRTQGDSVEE